MLRQERNGKIVFPFVARGIGFVRPPPPWSSLSWIFSRGRGSLGSGPLRHDHSQPPLIHANSSVCPIIVDCTERVSKRCPEWRVRAFKLLLAYGQILHGERLPSGISQKDHVPISRNRRGFTPISMYRSMRDWTTGRERHVRISAWKTFSR